MKTPASWLLPLLFVAPGLAAETFPLSGSERGEACTGRLVLDGEVAEIEVGALRLRGELREGQGTLQAAGGMRGALSESAEATWTARLRRDGPRVELSLREQRRRGRRIELAGAVELGARDAAHEALIERFYQAFAAGDGDGMAACYADDVHFSDPVFPNLRGAAAGDMWRMLCESAPVIAFSGVRADERWGVAQWTADYELIPGNPVHNVIEARFELRDGKIVRHIDTFDFRAWSQMAFGKVVRWLPNGPVHWGIRRFTSLQLWHYRRQRD